MFPLARFRSAALAALLLASPPLAPPGAAQPAEPGRPWVLPSAGAFRLPPPPDAAATRAELDALRAIAAARTPEEVTRAAWWASTAPAYRWNQVALEESLAAGLNVNLASRRLALLHTALDDAMAAAWDSKEAHRRPRPSEADPSFAPALPTPAGPSYPDEHAAAAAVAAAILGEVFPERAAALASRAEEAARMRLVAGHAFPSDVEAGTALGRKVAAAALERGRGDGSDARWTGRVPAGPGLWNGTNPILPQAGTWKPWLLAAPDEFRPPPPAAADSPERAAEMAALRAFPRTPLTNARALFWEVAVGGLRNFEFWNLQAGRLLLEAGQGNDARRAARTFALLNVSLYDAGVACWDAKYAYWAIRPFQLDPEFRTAFPTPNHPSYPAAHSCYSSASAGVLAHLFPADAEPLAILAREAGDSRVWAGIHYPSDVAAGQRLGRQVAARAIERARAAGAYSSE
ncbi:phosphatase PAP2 family protein [Roseomonas nepalensis]|uniref:Phosphatase PAP2 family protein n=1 Tax=Muricoccus nepalensis TaxID=1854500 RepID=A0A502GEH2_9PROT|nr:phosphatase PAP2 family protein [Roseomonas nepalensis]TPG60519.1 phosphatase PAP2 family protein [Roseomonas nepalensis]